MTVLEGLLAFAAGLLAFGTVWFWLLSFAVVCAITALVENDEGVWATVVCIATVLSLNFLSKVPILDFIKMNPLRTLVFIGLYFALGVCWTLAKWYLLVLNRSTKYAAFRAKFMRDRNASEMTPELAAALEDAVNKSTSDMGVSSKTPSPAEHKADITRWGTYWPFSFVGTILNDVVRNAWNHIYNILQSTYQSIADRHFRTASSDMQMAAAYKAQQPSDSRDWKQDTRRRSS